jgi:hypothetical protein
MTLRTIGDVISNPFGTARLLEAHSTLTRTKAAGMTYDQICTVFPDAAKYSEVQLEGFIQIGTDLVEGRSRFCGNMFKRNGEGGPVPSIS